MTKAEKIYNALETIEEKGKVIYAYLFIYGCAIGFILIGIILFFTPENPELPKWALILIGLPFLFSGCAFLLMAIKFSLERYIYE